MRLFNKKHDQFIANVTRTALGEGYMVRSAVDYRLQSPNDLGNPIAAINDKDIEGLPESVAAMMIYGYCTIKYQDPSKTNIQALKELLESRGYAQKDIDNLMTDNSGSLFNLINRNLQYEKSAYIFETAELVNFYNNLCKRSTIFNDIDLG